MSGSIASRLTGLDALRGVAAAIVLVYHLPSYWPVLPKLDKGYLAVDFFFMLSGYVMARCYEHRLKTGLTASAFLKKRFWRLWPMVAIGALIALPMLRNHPPLLAGLEFASTLLFIPSFTSEFLFPFNIVVWSLLFELIANAVHALILFRLRTGHILAIAVTAGIIALILAINNGHMHLGPRPGNFLGGFPRVLFPYCIGIVLCRTLQDREVLKLSPTLTILALPAVFIGAKLAGIDIQGPDSWMFDITFIALACPALIAAGLSIRGGRFGTWLGAISYPLYALQLPVLDVARLAGVPLVTGLALLFALATLLGGGFRFGSYQISDDQTSDEKPARGTSSGQNVPA